MRSGLRKVNITVKHSQNKAVNKSNTTWIEHSDCSDWSTFLIKISHERSSAQHILKRLWCAAIDSIALKASDCGDIPYNTKGLYWPKQGRLRPLVWRVTGPVCAAPTKASLRALRITWVERKHQQTMYYNTTKHCASEKVQRAVMYTACGFSVKRVWKPGDFFIFFSQVPWWDRRGAWPTLMLAPKAFMHGKHRLTVSVWVCWIPVPPYSIHLLGELSSLPPSSNFHELELYFSCCVSMHSHTVQTRTL